MATSPIQQASQALQTQRKRLPKLGPYRLEGSAKRLSERRLTALVQGLTAALEAHVLELVPEVPPEAKTDAVPASLNVRFLLRPLTDKFVRRLTLQVDPSLSEAEREQRAAEKRVVSPLGIDVLGGEPWLRKELGSRAKEFSELCKDLAEDVERRIAASALEALEKGHPRAWLRREVRAAGGIGARRAKLIARDQVGKLQGALHEARQKDLGIESFIWRNSRDERVAGNPAGKYPDAKSNDTFHGNHWEREGREFLWKLDGGALVEVLPGGRLKKTVYVDGLPGQPGVCRCHGEPVLKGLEDLQELDRPSKVASRVKYR